MSYRQDLREAELAVIRAAEVVWAGADQIHLEARNDFTGPWTVRNDHFESLHETLSSLRALRSQLDSAPAPYSDDDTSRTAADLIAPEAGSLRRSVLVELYRRRNNPVPGATCDQMQRILKREHATVSPIFTFLRDTGWIVDSGERAITRAGRPAKVWVLAPGTIPKLLTAIALEET